MTDRRELSHLLRRVTFGPTSAEVDAAARDGVERTIARLFAAAAAPAPPSLGPDPLAALRPGATREQRQAGRKGQRDQLTRALSWWLARMAAAGGTAAEKLTFFWHGHWATSAQKVRSAPLMLGQQQTFRRYGTGDTGPLVRAMLRDPALILWLDGQKNTRAAPNENLARELMELFTLGVGTYTEDDVRAGARVLTGWQVDQRTGRAVLRPERHDPTAVRLLGRDGVDDVDTYGDLLVRSDHHVPFLVRRLWIRYGSGEAPSPQAVNRIAAAGRDTTALLRTLVTDPDFPATRGLLVKQPVEWAIGAVRQLGIDPAEAKLPAMLKALGQVPFRPPSVGGWPVGAAWLTTSSTEARLRAGQQLATLAPAAAGRLTSGDRLDALADLLVVDAWTDRTRGALAGIKDPRRLLALGLASPEYAVH
nr:DUF1800 domain-containing protein [uncultured Actinoplanes sp.]